MSSNIPTFSARKPGTSQSKPGAPPSTLRKLNPFPLRNAPAAASSRKILTQSSGLKRPSEFPLTSQREFKRITPLSLIRNKNAPRPVNDNQMQAVRLTFNEKFKTPFSNRNEPLSSVDNSIGNADSVENVASIAAQVRPRIQVEDKGTSPVFDWKTKDTEINAFKCKISILEKQIDEMTLKNSRIRIENDLKESKMKSEFDGKQRIINELTRELDTANEDRQRLKSTLEQYKKECLQQTDDFEKQQLEYEKTINGLREELLAVKSAESDSRSTLTTANLHLKRQVDDLEIELEKAKAEKDIYYSNFCNLKSNDCENERLKEDLISANQEIQRLNELVDSYKENARVNEILKGEINHYHQVQEENRHLKNQLDLLSDVHSRNLILKEQILGLQEQVETLNQLSNQKNVDLGELSYSKKRLNEWVQIVGADAPDIVVSQITELKQSAMLLRMENESLKADLKSRNANDSFKDSFSKSLELQLTEAKNEISQQSKTLKKLNRKCLLLEKERDSSKNVLDSYESEVTINFDDINKRRISQLEAIVDEYKSLLASHENDLKEAQEVMSKVAAKEKEVHELKSELERIKTLNPHLCTSMNLDVTTLQTREKNFRVIHLKENPLTVKIYEYNQEYNRLSEENTRLKCLVEVLESGDVADMTRQINEGIQHRSEMEKLKKSYELLERRHNALRDTFKKISKSFRETCYWLTGYKIDNVANNKYKLTHIYDRRNRSLIFEINKDKITMLEESPPDESLQDMIKTYLTEGNSYPAFLAAFTLDLFQHNNNQTSSFNYSQFSNN